MNKLFLSALTKAIHAYLKLDPESNKRLQRLQGKIVSIELYPLHFVFCCVFTEQGVDIIQNETLHAQTTIKGTPLQMMGVVFNKEDRMRFFADDVIIEGDAELGQQVIALFDECQIDRAEYLSHFIGDVPAYHVDRLINQFSQWLQRTEKSFSQDIHDYLHEETLCFPSRERLEDFYREIDVLRMDVDRVEAKINYLKTCYETEL